MNILFFIKKITMNTLCMYSLLLHLDKSEDCRYLYRFPHLLTLLSWAAQL